MTPKVTQFLNRTVLVSIPGLFDGGACRPFKLLGIEAQGLWLQSEELSRRLLAKEMHAFVVAEPAVFVPFAQIAGVLVPTKAIPPGLSQEDPASPQAAAPRRKTRTARAKPK